MQSKQAASFIDLVRQLSLIRKQCHWSMASDRRSFGAHS
jgi:hypothetical protein